MLDAEQLLHWCQGLNLTERAESLIQQVRSSAPTRHVQGGRGNVAGRFPSRKMGVTIQFESHKNELARIRELEHDPEVLEYYDQPPTIKLAYRSAGGRRLGVLHTPDFFVLRESAAGWEECKTEEELVLLGEKRPHRYRRDETGNWRCPPGEEYAAPFSFDYRVRSSAQINWTWQRNIEFLDDYLRADAPPPSDAALTAVHSHLARDLRLTFGELLRLTEGSASRDDLYLMIARGEVYVDLCAAPLTESEQVHVTASRQTATAYSNVAQMPMMARAEPPPVVCLAVGAFIEWDTRRWTVINVGATMIGLLGEGQAFTELPVTAFARLVRAGRIMTVAHNSVPEAHAEVRQRLVAADSNAYAEANRRAEAVRAYLGGERAPESATVPARTLSRWVKHYRVAQAAFGNGFVGLLPQPRGGNTRAKLPAASSILLTEFIARDYETLKQKRKFEVYAAYARTCEERGVVAASYKTFCHVVARSPRYEQMRKRQGPRAAYEHQPWHWELELTTPRHGERPFQIAHIDHTELDVELVCSVTGQPLGRPWATFLTDAYSRRLPAIYLTFDPPSYRSCMMVIRECVRRTGRLPQTVVVDGGLEFSGVYFETLLARYECTKKTRPPAQSRFGSVCERLFGTANTQFIHNLQGNTQLMCNVRQVTKAVNPRQHAVWTLGKLSEYLCEWAYEVYDTREHPALGQSPRETFTAGMAQSGERLHRLIPYDENFRLFTLPTTRKGTAKVVPGCGVKINHLYYWAEALRDPDVERTQVEVRFDPYDAGVAYAYVARQWVACYSEYYSVFHERSERELMLASEELRRRHEQHSARFTVTAAKLAQFLASVEAEEVLLRQCLADREAQGARQMSMDDPGAPGLKAVNIEARPPIATVHQISEVQDSPLEAYGEF